MQVCARRMPEVHVEEGIQSIKEKGLRVVSSLRSRIISIVFIKESLFRVEDKVELDLEAIDFYQVVGYQWLRRSLESRQSGQGVGALPFPGTMVAIPARSG